MQKFIPALWSMQYKLKVCLYMHNGDLVIFVHHESNPPPSTAVQFPL